MLYLVFKQLSIVVFKKNEDGKILQAVVLDQN